MMIVRDHVSIDVLKKMAEGSFLDFVKAVVDIKREVVAIGGEMHADAEAELLQDGSVQDDLWGINLFPDKPFEQVIEFTSLINIRPRADNKSMEIQNDEVRGKIKRIVSKLLQ
ncbi:MAG: DUF5674 family protein [bacterium]|nr:DUF5674 family protein [bacterium]